MKCEVDSSACRKSRAWDTSDKTKVIGFESKFYSWIKMMQQQAYMRQSYTNCWIGIVFLIYSNWIFVLRISPFLVPIWYGYLMVFVFLIPFVGSIYHARTFMYVGNIIIVASCHRMVLTQLITHVYKESLTLTYPPNINISHILQFRYLWVGSLISYWYQWSVPMHKPIY